MNAEAEKANSRKNESNINVESVGWDKQEELEELMDQNFQPTVH